MVCGYSGALVRCYAITMKDYSNENIQSTKNKKNIKKRTLGYLAPLHLSTKSINYDHRD